MNISTTSYECTFVILGATGDLAQKKLIPAIYRLLEHKKIKKCALIGVALDVTTIDDILEKAKKYIPKIDGRVWKRLRRISYYLPFNFYHEQDYRLLHDTLGKIEKSHGLSGNRIFYLATMPEHFDVITYNLSSSKIVKRPSSSNREPWSRIVYEKPFGYDLTSAKIINKNIKAVFDESQIYRIDHYLGKELIGNIALIRFTNQIFEPLWNNKHIESVQIVSSEKIGIEGRGIFYDSTGALRDMVQSHMLQIMALVGMEAPRELSGNSIHNAKAAVLKKIKIGGVVVGQYEGYHQEKGVAPHSQTETFAALKLFIDNKRWKDVPFYLKTGKQLDTKETSIHIKFKTVKCLLNEKCPPDANYLTIQVQPEEGFFLELNTKIPGENNITPVIMDVCHNCVFGPNTPEAYETLLLDVVRGDQSVFVRSDEIELSWKIIDEVKKRQGELYHYKKGSKGPQKITRLDTKPIEWRA